MKLSTTRRLPALLLSLSAIAAHAGDAPVVSQAGHGLRRPASK